MIYYVVPITPIFQIESDAEFVAPCGSEVEHYAAKGVPAFVYSFEHVPANQVRNYECVERKDENCQETTYTGWFEHFVVHLQKKIGHGLFNISLCEEGKLSIELN